MALSKKLVLAGSALAFISVFLPWYSDIDRFKIGDTFLGISGPLYLAGLMVLVASSISLGLIVLELMEKPLPKLHLEESKLHILNGGMSVFMLILAASVYFHSKFGINLTDKSAGIGMSLGFMGSGLSILGGFLNMKVKDETVEPLINIEDREQSDIKLHEKMTVADALALQEKEEAAKTKAWDYAQDAINHYHSSEEDTKDIR